MMSIALATEDQLSEAIGERLVRDFGKQLQIGSRLRRHGSGYLRSRLKNFAEMARQQPVLLITDLDGKACPSELLADWLGSLHRPAQLLMRVAVREVESWLLATCWDPARAAQRSDSLMRARLRLLELAASV